MSKKTAGKKSTAKAKKSYEFFLKPEYYRNRELSWLQFNERVLHEARDEKNPLFERLKFLSITASNLDEFYMVRVASLKDQVHSGYERPDLAGMTPRDQLRAISASAHGMVSMQYNACIKELIPSLKAIGFHIYEQHEKLSDKQFAYIDAYFDDNIYPVLTPMAHDSSRPFPLVRNKVLNIGALIRKKSEKNHRKFLFATVQVPSVLPRYIEIPKEDDETHALVLIDEVIERNLGKLFSGYDVICAHPYRIMRNAELGIDEEDAADLLQEIRKQLKKRQRGEVIRLEAEEGMDPDLLKILRKEFGIKDEDIFHIPGPIDLTFLMKIYGEYDMPDHKWPKFIPAEVPDFPEDKSVFSCIRKKDIFVHHPYMDFTPVVRLVQEASKDPHVLAIKQMLYRVSGNSPIISALAKAAENGKQVTVLVELKARFDEENNIAWAEQLEKAGCHVIYGLVGLKTHSKITLIVRREEGGIRRYVHLGTGNYNDSTARQYTDCGLFTCNERICEDASAVFNMISGYSEPDHWNELVVAPLWMRKWFLRMIRAEEKQARQGNEAHIIAKMNSLCDREIIAALYKASEAGVRIDLIVRGICCLKVGIPGVSETITVRSIVGNFLEHARIFYFYNGGMERIYMGSADWMPRNLDKRVELVFPLEDQACKEEVKYILATQLADTEKASVLQSDGSYSRVSAAGMEPRNCQMEFCARYAEMAASAHKPEEERFFIPKEAPVDKQFLQR